MQHIHNQPQISLEEDGFESRRRGKARELMFLHAWRNSLHDHLWLRSVREANRKEDQDDHIDAFLMLVDGREIPVQIKGTAVGARDFKEKWNPKERGIVVVVVGDDYSQEEVVYSTIHGLEIAHARLGLEYSLVHIFKITRFLLVWKSPSNHPNWFQSVREAESHEKKKFSCDVVFARSDGSTFPAIIAHDLRSVTEGARLEKIDGISRSVIFMPSSYMREDVLKSTELSVGAMDWRQNGVIRKRRPF